MEKEANLAREKQGQLVEINLLTLWVCNVGIIIPLF